MSYYIVEPEVPGHFGDGTVLDVSGDPWRVTHLEYCFDGWLGDELITSHPAFAATESLAEKFIAAGLTGFELRNMGVTRSEQFLEIYPGRELPPFVELVVTGKPGVDDFGINDENELVLSQTAVDILKTTNPRITEIRPVGP